MRCALVFLVLLACSCKNEGSQRAPVGSAAGSAIAKPIIPDDVLVGRWFAAMEKQLDADARALAVQKFASREDVEHALMGLTPAGFKPRPEFFQAFYAEAGEPTTVAKRLADYASTHGDDMERRTDAMLKRLEPAMKLAADNAERQFAR
ncbi:MAG TPA: hypothetical protein VFV99_06675 [Kofleriaceae bacterium]|nr:hypothetical protein [Kofleriaceae bacterium]